MFELQVMAEYTHTIGFTFTAFHAFSVTTENSLMSIEEARHLLSKDEMRNAIADEAVDEVTNDHNPSEKLGARRAVQRASGLFALRTADP